jgi:adenylate kinase
LPPETVGGYQLFILSANLFLLMIITVTGTPGTGKTSVSEQLDMPAVHTTAFIEDNSIGERVDGEFEVDTDELADALEEEVANYDNVVVEGHLSHHLKSDICIVLRCRPDVLKQRLSQREYSEQKVRDNLESEILDTVLSEAVSNQKTVVEIDTTDSSVEETVNKIEKRIEKCESDYGEIDWTPYLDVLLDE